MSKKKTGLWSEGPTDPMMQIVLLSGNQENERTEQQTGAQEECWMLCLRRNGGLHDSNHYLCQGLCASPRPVSVENGASATPFPALSSSFQLLFLSTTNSLFLHLDLYSSLCSQFRVYA